MKKKTLTLGAKLGIGIGVLGFVIVCMAAVGLRSLGMAEDIVHRAADVNAQKVKLAGAINTAESDMAAGQRGLILFTYAKNSAAAATSEAIFRDANAVADRNIAAIRPLIVTERGRDLLAGIETKLGQWRAAYEEVRKVALPVNDEYLWGV